MQPRENINKVNTTPQGLNKSIPMSTYTQIFYQIVFSTKNRAHTLKSKNRQELFKYISGILKNKNCHLYQIGGVTDHIQGRTN